MRVVREVGNTQLVERCPSTEIFVRKGTGHLDTQGSEDIGVLRWGLAGQETPSFMRQQQVQTVYLDAVTRIQSSGRGHEVNRL